MSQQVLTQTPRREERAAAFSSPHCLAAQWRQELAHCVCRIPPPSGAAPRTPAPPGISPSQHGGDPASPLSSKAAFAYCTNQAGYRYRIEGGKACILFADTSSKDLAVPEAIDGVPVTAIAAGAFSDLAALERVSLPDSLTSLGAEAFARCTSLRAAKLGCALESIGEGAFRGCRHLERLDLPKSLTSIGDSAFSNTSLSQLAIPSSCVNIGDDALCTGPSFPGSAGLAYASSLNEVSVAPGNHTYKMHGGVLCREVPDGRLDAVFCPGSADDVVLGERVRSVANTFAGTHRIAHLFHLRDRLLPRKDAAASQSRMRPPYHRLLGTARHVLGNLARAAFRRHP